MAWRRELVVGAVGGRGVVVIHGRRRVFVRTSGLLGYFQDKIVLLLLFLHFYKQTNKNNAISLVLYGGPWFGRHTESSAICLTGLLRQNLGFSWTDGGKED